MTGDIASELVAGVDRFLLKQIDLSTANRLKHWKRDFSSPAAYTASVEPNRRRLAHILGVRDHRSHDDVDHLTYSSNRSTVFRGTEFGVHTIRWPAFGDVTGEGLEAIPKESSLEPIPHVIVIPDADQTPEQLLGLAAGVAARVASRSPVGRKRLPRDRSRSHRPNRGGAQRPGQADQPRIRLPLGLRTRPAPDRLRSTEGPRPDRLAD